MSDSAIPRDGPVGVPTIETCDPLVPGRKCAERKQAERSGEMYFNQQARGWVYPRPVVIRLPIETWRFCPFCLFGLPPNEIPHQLDAVPYKPVAQGDDPK